MSSTELKREIHNFIDNADERFLRMVYSLASEYTKMPVDDVVCYRAGKPITKKQLYKELKEAEAEIERGDYITIEELEKESGQWT
ncbi:MAG: hypothetical protein KJ607_15020 [Bacteroidetes bacterium]|nr:hypothetical protein [Bacteroidota bacterium]